MVNHEHSGEQTGDDSANPWDAVADYGNKHPFGSLPEDVSVVEMKDDQVPEDAENDPFFADRNSPDLGAESIAEATSQPHGKEIRTPQLLHDYDKGLIYGEQVGETIVAKPESAEHASMRQEQNQKKQDQADAEYLKSHYMRSSMRGHLGVWDYSRMSKEDKADAERKRQLAEMDFFDARPLDFKIGGWEDLSEEERRWHNGWFLATEGGRWLDKKVNEKMRKDNPEVFNPSKELVIERIRKVVLELNTEESQKELMRFADLFGNGNYSEAVTQAAVFFSEIYGLKDIPNIRMMDPKDDVRGFQEADSFVIATNVRATPWGFLNTLSHELWHARQQQAINNKEPGSELLSINLQNYQDANNGIIDRPYFTQLVEMEARAIGGFVGEAVHKNMPLGKRIKYGLQRFRKPKANNKTPDATPSVA